jgi:formylglycine-generating enzyme required for sulfatase activity
MLRETGSYDVIRRVLDHACTIFESVRLLSGSDDGAFRIYRHQASHLVRQGPEVIVLPKKPGLNWKTFHQVFRPQDGDAAGVVIVDCFNDAVEWGLAPIGMKVVSPIQLWFDISGIDRYRFHMEKSSENDLVEREYLERELTPIATDSKKTTQDRNSATAIETLLTWAQGVRAGGQRLLIFGERGSGKTWLLRRFAREQLKRHLNSPWDSPPAFFLSLQRYSAALLSTQGVRKTLAYFFHDSYPSAAPSHLHIWESAVETGAAILLLDGFDELANAVTESSMIRHLERLNFLLPRDARVILTTRGTVFPSRASLVNAFSGKPPAAERSQLTGDEYILGDDLSLRVQAHTIYSVTPFSPLDLVKLAEKKGLVKSEPNESATRKKETTRDSLLKELLAEHSSTDGHDGPARDACRELGTIPACAHYMLSCFQQRESNDKPISLIRLYELSLLGPLVTYNSATQRAIDFIEHRERGADKFSEQDVDVKLKLSVLEYIAWKLAESRQKEFDSDYIGAAALDTPSTGFQAVVNDLRSQTVFTFSESGHALRFRLKNIHAYFVARSIFSLLCDDEPKMLEGLSRFGRYDWTGTSEIEGVAGMFLRMFAAHGMLTFRSRQKTPDEFATRHWQPDVLSDLCERFVKSEPAYSMRTRFLRRNLEMLNIPIPDAVKQTDWDRRPIGAAEPAFQAGLTPGQGVLISGNKGIHPFLMSCHEVSNRDFDKFLASEWVPCFETNNGIVEVGFERRGPLPPSEAIEAHPLSWSTIHGVSWSTVLPADEKRFEAFTNSYHLFEAVEGGRFPGEKLGHPVVWISAHVAAIYLNWLTVVHEHFSKADCYYRILLKDGRPLIQRRRRALGFRLPTAEEWLFAARANDSPDDLPWSRFERSPDEEEKKKGKRLHYFLTQSYRSTRDVWTSVENSFGVFGMLGNVREWADIIGGFEKPANSGQCRCQVVGSTAALGVETFQYSYPGIPLFPQNTNPDVGFRWARSVSQEVLSEIQKATKRKK